MIVIATLLNLLLPMWRLNRSSSDVRKCPECGHAFHDPLAWKNGLLPHGDEGPGAWRFSAEEQTCALYMLYRTARVGFVSKALSETKARNKLLRGGQGEGAIAFLRSRGSPLSVGTLGLNEQSVCSPGRSGGSARQ